MGEGKTTTKPEDKCSIDGKLFQCPDCGQVLRPVTPAQLQATAWPYHALYSLRHRRGLSRRRAAANQSLEPQRHSTRLHRMEVAKTYSPK